MPPATRYDPDDRALREAARHEALARQELHARNWRYYTGQHHRPLDPQRGDDNVILNLCKQAIDRTVAFLVPDFPTLQLDPGADTAAEAYLRRAWEAAGGATLLATLALNGALDGHAVARVVDDDPLPRVVALSGAAVTVFWQADDFANVLWYELNWQAGGIQHRQDIVAEEGRWLIREYRRTGGRWELLDELIWPYALGPIVDWQHLPHPTAYYGQDELPHAALNDTINRVASDVARILRFHAYPRTVGVGFEAGAVQHTAIDELWTIPNENAQVFNLEMHSDLSSSLRFLQTLTDAFLSESRVTMLHGDAASVKGVTNLAIRALYMDMLAKNEVLRRGYGRGLAALSQRLLLLAGFDPAAPNVHWGEPLPIDQAEQVRTLRQQVELGVLSRETVAAELGLDHSTEDARIDAARP